MIETTSAGGVVVNREKKICLVSSDRGYWMLPKGHVEKGESLEQTAVREVGEETGLEGLTMVKKLGVVKRLAGNNPNEMKTINYFLFKCNGDETLRPTMEIKEAKWVSLDDALKTGLFKEEKKFLIDNKREIDGG